MKRVVSSLTFFFLLLSLSNAFRTELRDLTEDFDHHNHDDHQLQIKSSPDGADSSKILLPTEASAVPDHTKSSPVEVEEKEATSEVETTPDHNTLTKVDLDLFEFINRHPVQIKNRFNRYFFPVYRFNPRGCRQLHRLMRYPRQLIGPDELGAAVVHEMDSKDAEGDAKILQHRHVTRNFPEVDVDNLRMIYQFTGPHHMFPNHHPRHHHHHHDDHEEEDDQRVEMKTEVEEEHHGHEERERKEEMKKHKDHDHENGKKYLLKKIRKFLGYF